MKNLCNDDTISKIEWPHSYLEDLVNDSLKGEDLLNVHDNIPQIGFQTSLGTRYGVENGQV